MQISTEDHEIGMDSSFTRFELLFNISFDELNGDSGAYESPYYLIHCTGCDANIGAKPITLSQKQVFQSQNEQDLLDSQSDEENRSRSMSI